MQFANKNMVKPLNFNKTQPRFVEVQFNAVKAASYNGIFHFHSNPELIYCLSGRLKISFISSELSLKSGDWIFLNSSCPHRIDASSGFNEHYSINFNPEILDVVSVTPIPKANHFLDRLPEYIYFPSNEITGYTHSLFKRAFNNFTSGDFVKRLALQSTIMELMAYVFDKKLPKSDPSKQKDKNAAIYATKEYIDKNYATVNLESAAENASMSYSYFSRIFKNTFNMSFSKYLTKVKVEKSVDFLTDTSLSITDIAMECGFSNLSHFVKCFREEKGITPNQFRLIANEHPE